MHAIEWPEGYLPGTTDNFVSNEVVVQGVTPDAIWAVLVDTSTWPTYYSNIAHIHFRDGGGPELAPGARLGFVSFDLPVEAEVTEWVPPTAGSPGRVAWHGWVEGETSTEHRLDVIHAWLIEQLDERRVRVLTQEPQNGPLAMKMASERPSPALNAHQEWLEGVVRYAKERVAAASRR